MERVLDNLKSNVGQIYTIDDVIGDKNKGFNNEEEMKIFLKTGQFKHIPGVKREEFEDENDYNMAIKRTHKTHQANYVIKPRRLL